MTATSATAPPPALDEVEREHLARQGFVLRRDVLDGRDLETLRRACECVVEDLARASRGKRRAMGSYVFEVCRPRATVIKWEAGHRDVMLGVEPLAHLDARVAEYAADPRLAGPAASALGVPAVDLYTEKLNLKRAAVGGPIVLHQDYPYWADVADDARRIVTALVYLDDADAASGCLEVAPGSHRHGLYRGRARDDFGAFELDPEHFDRPLVPVPAPAGSVIWLGPFLAHRSGPNRGGADRRALLYSYQPAGLRHSRAYIRLGPDL